MAKNQKGFGAVVVILLILVIGLVVAVGWLVFDRQKNKQASMPTDTQQATQQTTEPKPSVSPTVTKKQVDTTIHEVNISLKAEADLAKLPDYTPVSFKNYLSEKLRNNKSLDNGEAIVTPTWKISKISQVNIQGGQVPTDANGNSYPGGAPAVWVLTPAGSWDEESLNAPVCVSKNSGKIYEEFVSVCYPGGTKNPNGSIKTING